MTHDAYLNESIHALGPHAVARGLQAVQRAVFMAIEKQREQPADWSLESIEGWQRQHAWASYNARAVMGIED